MRQWRLYAQTHQKTVEVAVEKKVPYEKCEKCDRTAYQKAKEKCDNRKRQLEKKYKKWRLVMKVSCSCWHGTA